MLRSLMHRCIIGLLFIIVMMGVNCAYFLYGERISYNNDKISDRAALQVSLATRISFDCQLLSLQQDNGIIKTDLKNVIKQMDENQLLSPLNQDLNKIIHEYISRARSISIKEKITTDDPDYQKLKEIIDGDFIASLHQLSELYARKTTESYNNIKKMFFAILFGSLISIILLALLFIFPAIRRVRAKIDDLQFTQEELKVILSNAKDGVLTIDRASVILTCNQAALNIFGYTEEELIGQDLSFTAPTQYRDKFKKNIKKFLETGQSGIVGQTKIVDIQTKKGEIRNVEVAVSEYWHDKKQRFVCTIRDVTEKKKFDNLLIDGKIQLEKFIQYAPAAIAMLDKNMCYLFVSNKWLSDYGLEGQEIIGKSHYDVFPDIPQRWKELHRMCLQGQVLACEEDNFERNQGDSLWIKWEIHPWYTNETEVGGMLMFTENITKRIRAQEDLKASEERFQLAVDGARDGIWDWPDVTKDEHYWSPQTHALIGYEVGEIENSISSFFNNICHPEDLEKTEESIKKCVEKDIPMDLECRFKRKTGEYIWFSIKGRACRYANGIVRITGSITDINNLKIALEKAEESTRLKSDFLANMSHEIRTPMNGIIGMASLIEGTTLTLKQQNYMKNLNQSAHTLLDLIDNIFDFSKLESGELKLENVSFNIQKVLEDVVRSFASQAEEKGLELLLEYDAFIPTIMGDPKRIKQILVNLIQNALKFTETGYVSVEVRLTDIKSPESVTLEIKIIDTGIGIPEDKREEIFNKFNQVDNSATRKYGGSGLGLAICAQLCKLMNADIALESVLAKGSTFTLSFVFKQAQEQNVVLDTIEDIKILLISSNSLFSNNVITQLQALKGNVDLMTPRRFVSEYSNASDYDIILMDLDEKMLFSTNFDPLIDFLRPTKTAVLLFSHQLTFEIEAELWSKGYHGYIKKPVLPSKLPSFLLKIVSLRQNEALTIFQKSE